MKRLGIAFSGGPRPSEIAECVKLAEALGYESAWVAEGHGGDQFAVLAACAGQTSSDATSIAGTPEQCRERIEAYRRRHRSADPQPLCPRPRCQDQVRGRDQGLRPQRLTPEAASAARLTGEGRCPWLDWVPACAGMTR